MDLNFFNLLAELILGIIAITANTFLLYIAIKNKIILKNFANFAISQIFFSSLILSIAATVKIIKDFSPSTLIIDSYKKLNECLASMIVYIFGYQIRDSTAIFIQLNKLVALKWPIFFRKCRLMGTIIPTITLTFIYAIGSIIFLLSYYNQILIPNSCFLWDIFGRTNIIILNSMGIIVSSTVIIIKLLCVIITRKMNETKKRVKVLSTNSMNNKVSGYRVIKPKSFKDAVARALFFDFLNYIFIWSLPQFVYLILIIINAPTDVIEFTNIIQRYSILLNSILNIVIFIFTVSEWRKLFINEIKKVKKIQSLFKMLKLNKGKK
uniref:G_PROTEIN_RECEP_F1_2 domain-containing protein n=1 Tax=Strongyloides stercoralis TaxID=6248 RepID=A0A0K0ENX2_STRER